MKQIFHDSKLNNLHQSNKKDKLQLRTLRLYNFVTLTTFLKSITGRPNWLIAKGTVCSQHSWCKHIKVNFGNLRDGHNTPTKRLAAPEVRLPGIRLRFKITLKTL